MVSENLIVAIISGTCAVLGACAGGFFAIKASSRQSRQQLLLKAYSRVLTSYAQYVTTDAPYPPTELIAAIETARLLCRSSTEDILSELESHILMKNPDKSKLGVLVRQLRLAARKEVKKA